MDSTELSTPPGLARLYAGAVLGGLRRSPATATLPATELVLGDVTVDRGHLAGYDRVCGIRLRDQLPATYPHVLAFPLAVALMSRPDFPLPLLGLVHVANRVELLRPIDAGEALTFRVRSDDLRPHVRGRQVDIVASALVGDEEVWRGRSTYLRREPRSARGAAESGAAPPTTGDAERPEPPTPSAVWRVERRVGADYAAASGDRNPIHTSRLLAKTFGFPRTIAHGMWSKARCLAALEGRLPDAYAVEVGFKLPILLPAPVAFSASPAEPAEPGGAPDGGWRFALHDARSGRPHLVGTLTRT